MRYPNQLKELRKKKGFTQQQVALQMGKQCEDRISEWEQGKSMPNVFNAIKLSEIYEVSIGEIYPHLKTDL